MPRPYTVAHNALKAVVCLSVCLFVPCLTQVENGTAKAAENWQKGSLRHV